MSVSHVETFGYSDWTIRRVEADVYSSGTASKLSQLYPISKVIGTIQASATGGYGWCSAYVQGSSTDVGDSLYCNLTVTLYLVAKNGQKIGIASATGSAGRSGYLDVYTYATTGTLTFDTSTLTAQQKELYESFQIGYSCSTSKAQAHVEKIGAFDNGGTGNPTGSASITIRDTINVDYDEVEMTNLFHDGNEMAALFFDGNQIF